MEELGVMLAWFKRVHRNRPHYTRKDLPAGAPEVYIALTPAGGIPGYGDVGTSSVANESETPSHAECQVYCIDTDGTFSKVEGLIVDVYNIGEAAIDGYKWIRVERDKFGNWIAESGDPGTLQSDSFTCVTSVSFDPVTCLVTVVTSTVTVQGRDIDITVT